MYDVFRVTFKTTLPLSPAQVLTTWIVIDLPQGNWFGVHTCYFTLVALKHCVWGIKPPVRTENRQHHSVEANWTHTHTSTQTDHVSCLPSYVCERTQPGNTCRLLLYHKKLKSFHVMGLQKSQREGTERSALLYGVVSLLRWQSSCCQSTSSKANAHSHLKAAPTADACGGTANKKSGSTKERADSAIVTLPLRERGRENGKQKNMLSKQHKTKRLRNYRNNWFASKGLGWVRDLFVCVTFVLFSFFISVWMIKIFFLFFVA